MKEIVLAGRANKDMKQTTFGGKRRLAALLVVSTAVLIGCGDQATKSTTPPHPSASSQGPQTYLSAIVAGDPGGSSNRLTAFQVDDKAKTFSQTIYIPTSPLDPTTVVSNPIVRQSAGSFNGLARGLLSLEPTLGVQNPSQAGGWTIELAGQAGGLVELQGQPVTPLVAAQSCPDFSTAQTFQFVTIPAVLTTGTGQDQLLTWNPAYDTAYGSVDVTTNGSTVTFQNIQQFTTGKSKLQSYPTLPDNPAAITSTTGTCSQTFYGNTISVPNFGTITLPPGSTNPVTGPAAIVGIGPSGLLVESNNSVSIQGISSAYQPFLGAGSGAIGLPRPSSPLSASALTGAQYLGFFYSSGQSGWSSPVASFGFSMPTSCPTLPPQTGTMIYGGDFPGNNPGDPKVQDNGGYGTCDVAIDLGAQDPSNNGLFPSATVWVDSSFSDNTAQKTSFPAVAVAGQLGGKYAIFLIGVDTTQTPNQAWGIYLLQSN
jgi:hypothetical protein